MRKGLETIFLKAIAAEKRGDANEALRLYQSILGQFPNNARARRAADALTSAASGSAGGAPQDLLDKLLANYRAGRFAQVVEDGERLRALYASSPLVDQLIGAAHAGSGNFAEAEAAFRRSVALDPRNAQAHFNLAVALQEQHRLDAAVQVYSQTLSIQPDHIDAQFNLATALDALGKVDDAITAYGRLLILAPGHLTACYNLGNAYKRANRLDDAIRAYERALAINPRHAPSHNNRGVVLEELRRLTEAELAYRRSLEIDAEQPDAWNNLGNVLRQTGDIGAAIDAYGRATALNPGFAQAHNNLGNAYRDLGDLPRAVEAYDRALAIQPKWQGVLAQKLHHQAQMCDWSAYDQFGSVAADIGTGSQAIPPFTLLAFEDHPQRQLARSATWARANYGGLEPSPAVPRQPADTIRIGYFSADFHNHATMFLMSGLFRKHDRARFTVHAYSYGATAHDEMRDALIGHVDGFHDVRSMSDKDIVALAHSHALDVAVDLKGYTADNRCSIFALRPAPVQIAFLGYPGSLGTDFIDYIIADPVVVPKGSEQDYSEAILRLPHCYQPNDDQRPIAASAGKRTDHGLPDRGFVFCCFNNSYKIGPAEFDVWMPLLGKTAGSVLWLLRSNGAAEANLRMQAETRGIAGDRIIFADRLPMPQHLARHSHADLFLDSFAYNAHTTASDALWAGLPLITLAGRQFAARVGASLLNAVGLPELVATTPEDYEAMALDLAASPESLNSVREQLRSQRPVSTLFDTTRFARDIERGFAEAHRRQANGLPPADIDIGILP